MNGGSNSSAAASAYVQKVKHNTASGRKSQELDAATRLASKHTSTLNNALGQYKYAAEKREIVWDLHDEYAKWLMILPCHYCRLVPDSSSNGRNGIDRYDNTLGYIAGNVVACCAICNRSKNDLHGDDFIARCKLISERARRR